VKLAAGWLLTLPLTTSMIAWRRTGILPTTTQDTTLCGVCVWLQPHSSASISTMIGGRVVEGIPAVWSENFENLKYERT